MTLIEQELSIQNEHQRPTIGELVNRLNVLGEELNRTHIVPVKISTQVNQVLETVGNTVNALTAYEAGDNEWKKIVSQNTTDDNLAHFFTTIYNNQDAIKVAGNTCLNGVAFGENVVKILGVVHQLRADLRDPKIRAQFRRKDQNTGKPLQVDTSIADSIGTLMQEIEEEYNTEVIPIIKDIEPFGSSYSLFDIKYLSTLNPNNLTSENLAKIEGMLETACEDESRFTFSLFLLTEFYLSLNAIGASTKNRKNIYTDPRRAVLLEASKVLAKYFEIYQEAAMNSFFIPDLRENSNETKVNLSLLNNKVFGLLFAMHMGTHSEFTHSSFERLLRSGYIPSLTSQDIDYLSEWFTKIVAQERPQKTCEGLYKSAQDLHANGEASEVFKKLSTVYLEDLTDENITYLFGNDHTNGKKTKLFEKATNALLNTSLTIPIDIGDFSEISITASSLSYLDIFLVSTTNEAILLQIDSSGRVLGLPEIYDSSTLPFLKNILNKVISALLENNILFKPQNASSKKDSPLSVAAKAEQKPQYSLENQLAKLPTLIVIPRKRSQQRRRLGLPNDLGIIGTNELIGSEDRNMAYKIIIDDQVRSQIPDNKLIKAKLGTALKLLQTDLRDNKQSSRLHGLKGNTGMHSIHLRGYRALVSLEMDPETRLPILRVTYFGTRDNGEVYNKLRKALRR